MRSWHVFAIAAVLIAAVAAGAWLLGRGAAGSASGITQSAQAGDLRVTLRVDDAAIGTRVFDVNVTDQNGDPAALSGVRLRFSMIQMDMGASEIAAEQVGAGHFQAHGPYFTMVGDWAVEAILQRDGQAPLQVPFTIAVAARGEAAGPINPLKPDARTIAVGQQLYAANCVPCHGANGKGDGPNAAGLNPPPADFTRHMGPGLHTDGQIFLWISDGFPNSAMPAWKSRLTEQQIWQLVTYMRATFGQITQATPQAQSANPTPPAAPEPTRPSISSAQEPLPPMVFARQGNVWRSAGDAGPPRQLTSFGNGSYVEYPSFSPDGARVAFVLISPPPVTSTETVPLPSSTLFVMNADGSGQQPLWKPAQGLLGMPTWAHDSQSLYVAANGVEPNGGTSRQLQIFRLDIAGGARQKLLDDVLDPSLSRDGKQLAFLKLSEDGYSMSVMVGAPDGSGAKEVIKGDQFQGFYAPRFSPDGKRIVVAAIGGPETDSQGNPRSASAPSAVDRLLGLFEPPAAEAHGLPWDLWVANTDGTGLRRLALINEDLPMATFSPDGKQIAVQGAGGIYLMNADGSKLRRIDPLGDHGGLDWAH